MRRFAVAFDCLGGLTRDYQAEDKAGIVEIGIEPEANLGEYPVARPSVKDPNGITLFAKGEHMRPETTMQSPAQLQPS
jgi:hypothetical protein